MFALFRHKEAYKTVVFDVNTDTSLIHLIIIKGRYSLMFNSNEFFDKYCGYKYNYHGTCYEIVGAKHGKVILQDLNSDYSTTINLIDWDDFHKNNIILK